MNKGKTLFLLIILSIISLTVTSILVLNINNSPHKKKCKTEIKLCKEHAKIIKRQELQKCVEERIFCRKQKKDKTFCRKQARDCTLKSSSISSTQRKKCNLIYKDCLKKDGNF